MDGLPLDKTVCDLIDPKLYSRLMAITGHVEVLDIEAFTAARGYEPCIGSRFNITTGGSVTWMEEDGSYISTYNGTLESWSHGPARAIGETYWRIYSSRNPKSPA